MALKEEDIRSNDLWQHRSRGMRCATCMFFVEKRLGGPVPGDKDWLPDADGFPRILGRCRRHAPTLSGWPAIWDGDWCGDHKLDENKL